MLYKQLKISSPKDVVQLKEAKELAYKEGFYQGTMIYGPFKGQKVEVVKPIVQQEMIDAGDAFRYAEPEGRVVSRSGDECIVALLVCFRPRFLLVCKCTDSLTASVVP